MKIFHSSLPLQGQQMNLIPLLLSLLSFSLVLFLLKLLSTTSAPRKRLPPSPPKLPILGNFHQLRLNPHRTLQAFSQRYGPLMLLHFGTVPVLVVSSPDAAREVMKTHNSVFSNRNRAVLYEKLGYNRKDVVTGDYGPHWRQMRSICVVQLLNNKRVEAFQTLRDEEVAIMVQEIEKSSRSRVSVNLNDLFIALTNSVLCRAALGRKYIDGGELGKKYEKLVMDFIGLFDSFNIEDYIPWLGWVNNFNGLNAEVNRVSKEMDVFLEEVIQEHSHRFVGEGTDGAQDFVDVILGIQKEGKTEVDMESFKGLILDVFLAATETTQISLQWCMAELLRNPKIMKKLQDEVRGIIGDKPNITNDDLQQMHYLKAVIKETLRFHPPLPLLIPRSTTQDVCIDGYDIAAETMVIVNAWAIGRDPASWEAPDEFRPERFLYSSIDFKGQCFEFIPFGSGRRICPGISFADAIIELAIANLMHKFDWALPENARAEDLDMAEKFGITLPRKSPLLAVPTLHAP